MAKLIFTIDSANLDPSFIFTHLESALSGMPISNTGQFELAEKPTCAQMQNLLKDLYDTDEELFIYRAKDELLPLILKEYIIMAVKNDLPFGFISRLYEHKGKVETWQSNNPDKVRLPD